MRVPLKSLNAICANVSDETLYDLFIEQKFCTADFLLWIWKNRKKRDSAELLQLLNVDNVSRGAFRRTTCRKRGGRRCASCARFSSITRISSSS